MKIRLLLYSYLLLSLAFPANKLYIGNDDYGNPIAGIESSYKVEQVDIIADVKFTQTEQIKDYLFSPHIVNISLEITNETLGYIHECEHGIDTSRPINITDKVYIKLDTFDLIK